MERAANDGVTNNEASRSRVRPGMIYAVVAIVLAGLIFMSWQSSVRPGIRVNDRAPAFSLPTVTGQTVQLNDFFGTPVVLRFSSRNCSYCGDDFTALTMLQEAAAGSYQIIAIETDTRPQDVVHALQGREVPFPILLDADGTVAGRYQVKGLPMFYWIDANGVLRATVWGEPSASEWQHHIDIITAGRPGAGRGAE